MRDVAAIALERAIDDYRQVGPDKRAIYLETDPYGLPSLQEHVRLQHAGLIHRCGKRRRGLRLRMDIWICVGAATVGCGG